MREPQVFTSRQRSLRDHCNFGRVFSTAAVMLYALKLYLYLGVGFVIAGVVSGQWLRHLSSTFVLGFGASYAALVVAMGRWLVRSQETVQPSYLMVLVCLICYPASL